MSEKFDGDDVKMAGQVCEIFGRALTAQAPIAHKVSGGTTVPNFLLGLAGIFAAISTTIDEINALDDQDEARANGEA